MRSGDSGSEESSDTRDDDTDHKVPKQPGLTRRAV